MPVKGLQKPLTPQSSHITHHAAHCSSAVGDCCDKAGVSMNRQTLKVMSVNRRHSGRQNAQRHSCWVKEQSSRVNALMLTAKHSVLSTPYHGNNVVLPR